MVHIENVKRHYVAYQRDGIRHIGEMSLDFDAVSFGRTKLA